MYINLCISTIKKYILTTNRLLFEETLLLKIENITVGPQLETEKISLLNFLLRIRDQKAKILMNNFRKRSRLDKYVLLI